jgi:DNA primase catalytic core
MVLHPITLYFTAFLSAQTVALSSYFGSSSIVKRPKLHSLYASTNEPSPIESGKKVGYIPDDTVEEIKTYADIVSVIESYNLPFFTRSSDGYRAKCLCPFHNDRNPSLNIDNSKGIYKCFSCGAGGDVFNFVREYDFISNQERGEKMSYPAAIQMVANEFCDGAIAQKVRSMSFTGNVTRNMTPERMQKIREQNHKKERILLANSVAAEFYARTLITNPAAGCCRSYLSQRGITPAMVRTFALGFAPDTYYGYDNTKFDKNTWGSGSLVERLKELNFTAQEILEAGLATVTSRARSRLQMSVIGPSLQDYTSNDAINGTVANMSKQDVPRENEKNIEDKLEYGDLMDRFRRRLVVPIFDYSGEHIIGFGGRHLDIEIEDDSAMNSFTAAKYLNTPDTLVFAKKNVLFGLHTASATIEERTNRKNDQKVNPEGLTFNSEIPTLVIVEGYFDAITLYGAGVKEAVASMGTALTSMQLNLAAKALRGRGRIVLCLDNDEAGLNAVERICTDPEIWQFLKTNGIYLDVASLPSGMKDPAEFIEANGGVRSSKSGDLFRSDVLMKAISWTDWFVTRLISKYDPSDPSSFSSVCDNLSTFLSTHPNAAERTKRAYEAAGELAELISKGRGSPSNNAPLRIQLESDLLGMASRKAAAREALARRIEAADGDIGSKSKILKMSSGEPTLNDDTKYTPRVTAPTDQGAKGNYTRPETKIKNSFPKYSKADSAKGKKYNEQKKNPPLTEHFHGFQFSETDAQWLGLGTEKVSKLKMYCIYMCTPLFYL